MTIDEFKDIVSYDRLTLIDFYATWCAPCKAMHPMLDRLERELSTTLSVVRIDVDRVENESLVELYRIMAVPTLILFRCGRKLWRESGVLSYESLLETMRRYERVELF